MQYLQAGLQSLTQNTIYALPARRCLIFTSDSTPTLQLSNDPAFSNNAAVTLTNGAAELAGGFLKCTSGNITANVKVYT